MNLDNLRDTIQNISLYDVKAAVRKAQNGELSLSPPVPLCRAECSILNFQWTTFNEVVKIVVMNYTEMEAKVLFRQTFVWGWREWLE